MNKYKIIKNIPLIIILLGLGIPYAIYSPLYFSLFIISGIILYLSTKWHNYSYKKETEGKNKQESFY